MKKIDIHLQGIHMEFFIKELLSLCDGGKWTNRTVTSEVKIHFKGNINKVQKAIYDWLSLPERRQNMEGK